MRADAYIRPQRRRFWREVLRNRLSLTAARQLHRIREPLGGRRFGGQCASLWEGGGFCAAKDGGRKDGRRKRGFLTAAACLNVGAITDRPPAVIAG